MNGQRLFPFDAADSEGRLDDYFEVPGLTYWCGFLSGEEQCEIWRTVGKAFRWHDRNGKNQTGGRILYDSKSAKCRVPNDARKCM